MGEIFLRKYGVEATVDFALYKLDGTGLKTDAASASGDVTLYRDEAAVETLDADAFTDEGAIYSLTLSATEMEASRIIVCIVDQSSPQVWLDKTLIIETYGNASAQHAFDLATATQAVNVTQIGGVAQSATDLKDLADTGYDPSTHKIQGVVLTDTCTTNTDMVTDTSANVTAILADTNELQGLITDSKIAAQVKGQDNIDFGALQKASIATATADIVIDGTVTLQESQAVILSKIAGKASGGGTNTHSYRDVADSKNRLIEVVDADGNRSSVTLDGA